MASQFPDAHALVFDHSDGVRRETIFASRPGDGFDVTLCGLNRSKKIYRFNTLSNALALSRFAPALSPVLREIEKCQAWLDISGGDSFTDLYGYDRFDSMAAPKELAVRLDKPLILLPQTYGPFQHEANRARAAKIV
jgi:polysaccharide pyruvyl transferase WcaK-like protein